MVGGVVTRALDLAMELGDLEGAIRALSILGNQRFTEGGRQTIEQCIELAQEEGLVESAGWIFAHAVGAAIRTEAIRGRGYVERQGGGLLQ